MAMHPIVQKRQLLSESYPSPCKSHIYIYCLPQRLTRLLLHNQSDIMILPAPTEKKLTVAYILILVSCQSFHRPQRYDVHSAVLLK